MPVENGKVDERRLSMNQRLIYVTILKEVLSSPIFTSLSRTELGYSSSEEANDFIFNVPMAFLVGLIFDQGISSTQAWTAPLHLRERLGHLDPAKIADMSTENLTEILRRGKALHRYPSAMAKNLVISSQTILDFFDGTPEKIWQSTTYAETKKNLLKMRGIGEKKANLGLLMLMRDHGVQFLDGSSIPLALDNHLQRVLARSGLFDVKTEKGQKEILDTMRKVSPELPSSLGTAIWHIGKNHCDTSMPKCLLCPLRTVCQKKI